MQITTPQALNEQGGRKNNEDAIYPGKGSATAADRLYLVCDGVGGQEKGEVASSLICQHFPAFFRQHQHRQQEEGFLTDGLRFVESRMKDYLEIHSDSKGMASTLTLLHMYNDEVRIGWVGDSRIYHIRDGKIKYKSKDHSEVQSLVDMGEITEEEAENHPRKNVITRAVSGDSPTRIDTHLVKDIREDDYFLLCTDGILETLKEADFGKIFRQSERPENVRKSIFKKAEGNTRDNFSMYLLKVEEISKPPMFKEKAVQSLKAIYNHMTSIVSRGSSK